MKYATNPYNTVHYTLHMLPQYLGKLEVQIRCLKKCSFNIESQRFYFPLIVMFLMLKQQRFYIASN